MPFPEVGYSVSSSVDSQQNQQYSFKTSLSQAQVCVLFFCICLFWYFFLFFVVFVVCVLLFLVFSFLFVFFLFFFVFFV